MFKLRAFDHETNSFFDVYQIHFYNPYSSYVDGEVKMDSKNYGCSYRLLKNVNIIRSTGVKNKFGRDEVWEGDILTNGHVKMLVE